MILNDIYTLITTNNDYTDIVKELDKVLDNIEPILQDKVDTKTIDNVFDEVATGNETAFIQGFKVAIKLIKECKI